MKTILIILFCVCNMDLEAASAIANIILAIVTVAALVFSIYQNWQLRSQKREDERARLSISIIERSGHYQLRIANIGLQTAYNIKLTFNKDFLEILKQYYLLGWENIQARPFNLEKGNSLYLNILPAIRIEEIRRYKDSDASSLKAKGHHDLTWLVEYGNKLITVTGTYNDAYKIRETFSLLDYIILGVDKDENPIIDALNNIGKGIGTGKFSSSINEQLKPIRDYYSRENAYRRFYGYRDRVTSQNMTQQPKQESIWSIIKDNLKKLIK